MRAHASRSGPTPRLTPRPRPRLLLPTAPRPSADPRAKQYSGARLANSALALRYKFDLAWRSPTYASAASAGSGRSGRAASGGGGGGGSRVARAVVQLADVSSLELRPPWNYRLDLQAPSPPPHLPPHPPHLVRFRVRVGLGP